MNLRATNVLGNAARKLILSSTPRGCGQTRRASEESTSGAEARTHFQQLNGTIEIVPFPNVLEPEFFRNLSGRALPELSTSCDEVSDCELVYNHRAGFAFFHEKNKGDHEQDGYGEEA